MMRPQVRVLLTLLIIAILTGGIASGLDLYPTVTAAAADLKQPQSAGEPAGKDADEGVKEAVDEATNEAVDEAMTGAEQEQESPSGEEDDEFEEPGEPAPPELSPEMAAFRDQVRRTLLQVYSRSLNAQTSLPTEVISFCEAFGHTAEIASGSRSGQKVNAVGAMCWNYPCGGYKLLLSDGEQVVTRVGYGYQDRPGQLLAMLARNRVSETYEIRDGDHRATVADLVASEKRACRDGLDQSGTLLGLAFYCEPAETWENDLGESWSLERLLQSELDRKPDASQAGVIHRLMAISFAVRRLAGKEGVSEALLDRAKTHIQELHDHTLELQNADGSWHPGFLAYRGTSNDAAGTLYSTGTILAWLVYSLPSDRLEDQRLVRGLSYLNKQLASRTGGRSAVPSSTSEVVGQMNAARALSLYDVRYFTPRTPKPAPKAEKADQRAAGK